MCMLQPEVSCWCVMVRVCFNRLMAMVLGINLRDMPVEEARYEGKH